MSIEPWTEKQKSTHLNAPQDYKVLLCYTLNQHIYQSLAYKTTTTEQIKSLRKDLLLLLKYITVYFREDRKSPDKCAALWRFCLSLAG